MREDWDHRYSEDEAEAYMRERQAERYGPPTTSSGRGRAGWTRSSPVGTSRRPPERSAEMERNRAEAKAWRVTLQSEYGALLARKAAELAERGETVIRTDRGTVRARILRFSDGTAVLQCSREGELSSGEGHMRLDPEILERDTLMGELLSHVLSLGPRARPIPD